MLSTKYLFSINDVPESWIFEFYAGLSSSLLGDDITLKSLFKPNEKTPSMKIFHKDGRYFYKDFSSGNGGTAINLVEKLQKNKDTTLIVPNNEEEIKVEDL